MKKLKVRRINKDLPLPRYQTEGAAGMDIYASIDEPVTILPLRCGFVPCGIAVEAPEGWQVEVRARSGYAHKYGVGLVNGVGTVDCDYRGEVAVILFNLGNDPFTIEPGDRIAQMVVMPAPQFEVEEHEELGRTKRDVGGYGSTGTK